MIKEELLRLGALIDKMLSKKGCTAEEFSELADLQAKYEAFEAVQTKTKKQCNECERQFSAYLIMPFTTHDVAGKVSEQDMCPICALYERNSSFGLPLDTLFTGKIALKCYYAALKEAKVIKRPLTEAEIKKGRSVTYWSMSAKQQWAEDKELGILDWDGK